MPVVATGADERQDEPPNMKKIKKVRPAKEFKLGPMLVYATIFVGDGALLTGRGYELEPGKIFFGWD